LNCLLKNNMHLERLAIMKWRLQIPGNAHLLGDHCPELTQVVKIKAHDHSHTKSSPLERFQ
jgi:hypothetical protein